MEESYCLSSSAAGVLGDQRAVPQHQLCHLGWGFTPVYFSVSLLRLDAAGTDHSSQGMQLLSCSLASAVWCSRHSISYSHLGCAFNYSFPFNHCLLPMEKKRTCIVRKEWKSFLDGTLLNKPLLVRVHKCLGTKEICWEKIEYTASSASWATPQPIFNKFKASDGIYKINK